MEKKINVAKLLKDCPKGMELDCIIFNNPVKYESANDTGSYPISVSTEEGELFNLSKYGCLYDRYDSKCAIFPKGKTTWEGFQRPFKDGDIVAFDNPYRQRSEIFILKDKKEYNTLSTCYLMLDGDELYLEEDMYYVTRFATEEEKAKLFQEIKDNGYKWNAETKTLDKLPKFKVGDKIVQKNSACTTILITNVGDEFYYSNTESSVEVLPISEQDDWELVPNKFDINTLIPFESKVLVRGCNSQEWVGEIFTRYNNKVFDNCNFVTLGGICWKQCIPYNDDTKHLLGTTDDCDEYFKNWE